MVAMLSRYCYRLSLLNDNGRLEMKVILYSTLPWRDKMDLLNNVLSVYQTPDLFAAGLTDLWNNVLKNWITPLYIAGLAVFAIALLRQRSWVTLLTFVAFAAIVGVLVFAGGDLFGSKNSGLTKVAKNAASSINTIDANALAAPLDGATSVEDVLAR